MPHPRVMFVVSGDHHHEGDTMNRRPDPAARPLRDRLAALGVVDQTQYGPKPVSLTQVDRNLGTVRAWDRGEISLAQLCETVDWVAPC